MTFEVAGHKVNVSSASREEFFDLFREMLGTRTGFAIATLNLDHLVKLHEDPVFRSAYNAHDIILADGNPIVWLSRLAGCPVAHMPGSDLIEPVCAIAAELGVPIAFIGSTQDVLDKATDRLTARFPALKVVARLAPPMGFDPDSPLARHVLQQAHDAGAQLCLLALGAPKQERFAIYGRTTLPDMGFISIGAGLDFLARTQIRAPRIIRMIAMEWLWRLAGSPRRLAWRYMKCAMILPRLSVLAAKSRSARR
ncbi:WecB/TagA/CpsF family glycosyltransferase [Roseinatronobacter sp. S2]|uniref:WecB/TagA/CpsF family glycosyltransferase n=1 Tax=Roseinatronobacter sp. S2 TaxID=3035471 RepID=UPI00241019D1|nr:WecB/TagA/CpsF family glycosyltransferase [Roseinatronobacter sp. S2]WFE75687.1 WecB/TagA/CpsF family glycosyltransferase [Roseinatronobacter sp. S2]